MKLSAFYRNRPGVLLLLFALAAAVLLARAQGVSTTTVQGTVYFANGAPASGTLQLTWPAFTTAAGQAITAGRNTVMIGADGFVTVNLAANVGATPAGLYYTAVYHLSDGTTSTEYWVVPAAAQVTLGQVRAQLMPAAQAVQAVSKSYVDQSIQQLSQSVVTAGGGTLSGPLYLSGDPSSAMQAATKRYVDGQFAQALPTGGGVVSGPLTAQRIGAIYQADQSPGNDFGAKLQSCLNGLDASYGGTCDARNFSGSLTISSNLTISTPNVTIYLPCATIATTNSVVIPAGTRNVTLHGCASRGTSTTSGSQGGTVFLYSGTAPLLQVGDSTYAADTQGFHLDNLAINTTSATASTAQAIAIWRTQELSLDGLYLLGNANQTGITLDGTGNYTGGTVQDVHLTGFQTAINAIGHQIANPATTDWLNASTFVRLHIDCPTSGGNPISGTTGINLLAGDGNTFTGGDVESCATAVHLGPSAQNNTIVGLRNENSTSQVVADAGSSYNNWMTGGTMFTGKLTDNGTRNSFLDTFHRSFNGLNGDWYGSQQDATITNHYRLGTGSGNERGLLDRYQTDYGYRWTTGLSDATAGEQFYQVLDELNNVNRLSIGQYNQGQPSSNNQTVINSAGTGAVVLNGSTNAGTGGVVIGSGGAAGTTVATISNAGNAQFNGSLTTGGTSQSTGTMTVRNNADAEVDYYLWPGLTTSQKGSFTYKDFNGASQWYLLKDANNNFALNSAVGGLDSFKAYQSSNSGDTYINASNATGAVRVNYEGGSGAAFNIYGGNSGTLYAGFTGPTSIKFPGLASASGTNCAGLDNSGYLKNAGAPCGTATSVPAAGLTFSDSSVQTTSQQGALTGGANDATARTVANAALPANGVTTMPGGTLQASTIAAGTTVVGSSAILKLVCDGTTDNYPAISAALPIYSKVEIAGCPSGSGNAVIGNPAGNEYLSLTKAGQTLIFDASPYPYVFTLDARTSPFDIFTGIAPLMVEASNVTIEGQGPGVATLQLRPSATSGTPLFPLLIETIPPTCISNGSVNGYAGCTATMTNINVSGLTLDGNSAYGSAACTSTDTNGDGIQFAFVQTGSIRANAVKNICFQSIDTYGGGSGNVTSNIQIEQNTVAGYGEYGIGLEGSTQSSHVTRNIVSGNSATSGTIAYYVGSLGPVSLSGSGTQDNEFASNIDTATAASSGKSHVSYVVQDGSLRTSIHDNSATGTPTNCYALSNTNLNNVSQSTKLTDNACTGATDTVSGSIRVSGGAETGSITNSSANGTTATLTYSGATYTPVNGEAVALSGLTNCSALNTTPGNLATISGVTPTTFQVSTSATCSSGAETASVTFVSYMAGTEISGNRFPGGCQGACIFLSYQTSPQILNNRMAEGCGLAAGTRQECMLLDYATAPLLEGNTMIGAHGGKAFTINSANVTSLRASGNNCGGTTGCAYSNPGGAAIAYSLDYNALANSLTVNAGQCVNALYSGSNYCLLNESISGNQVFFGDVNGHGMDSYLRWGGSSALHLQSDNSGTIVEPVTITGTAINFNSGATVNFKQPANSPGSGYMVSSGYLNAMGLSYNAGTTYGSAGRVYCIQFTMPKTMTFNKVGINVTSGATGYANVGFYNAAGNLLVDSGALNSGNTAVVTAAPALTTLYDGAQYYFCWAVSSTTAQFLALTQSSSAVGALLDANSANIIGYATNTISNSGTASQALPSTFGGFTTSPLSTSWAPLAANWAE